MIDAMSVLLRKSRVLECQINKQMCTICPACLLQKDCTPYLVAWTQSKSGHKYVMTFVNRNLEKQQDLHYEHSQ